MVNTINRLIADEECCPKRNVYNEQNCYQYNV